MKRLLVSLSLLLLLLVGGCSKKTEKIRIAATRVPHAEMLEDIRRDLLRNSIDLEISFLDDYEGANKDLAEGVTDANFFQHMAFLKQQVNEYKYPIESLVGIHIEPMQFYSKKIQNLSELTSTSVIAVPSDPANQARALNLLALNGVIKVRSDIDPSKLTIGNVIKSSTPYYMFEMEASELPGSIETVDLAVIPGNFALEAALTPMQDTVLLEENVMDYVNVIAVRKEDIDTHKMKLLKIAMTSEKMRNFILQRYNGVVIPVF